MGLTSIRSKATGGFIHSSTSVRVMILGISLGPGFTSVNLAMASQVRDDGEVTTTTFNFASKCYRILSARFVFDERILWPKGVYTYVFLQCGCTCGFAMSLVE